MDIKINHKMIKDMCGTVSFKRGDAFYRTNKVTFTDFGPDKCVATVKGGEDFYVRIEKKPTERSRLHVLVRHLQISIRIASI